MAEPAGGPTAGGPILVLAGTNGAGKSSIIGAALLREGMRYFNPDEATRSLLAANPGMTELEANSLAWNEGKRQLEKAITERLSFAFETTLGGTTIPGLLAKAADTGLEVRIWYAGLSSPELHIARVRARVGKGGHDIPEATIRLRYANSQLHLVELLPKLTELRMFDNSAEADPDAGVAPEPVLVLDYEHGQIKNLGDLAKTPAWAQPIVGAALKLHKAR